MKDDDDRLSESKPNPDPTTATYDALNRGLKAERDYVNAELEVLRERLRGIDRATVVLNDTITATPTEIQKQIGHLRELVDEKFISVATQFKERDTRSERESRDNKVAVDAAFAAQKEAAAKQDEANAKAIDKSEKATAEIIKTNQDVGISKTDALSKSVDELKQQVARIESIKQGGKDTISGIYAFAGFLVSLLILSGVFAAIYAAKK